MAFVQHTGPSLLLAFGMVARTVVAHSGRSPSLFLEGCCAGLDCDPRTPCDHAQSHAKVDHCKSCHGDHAEPSPFVVQSMDKYSREMMVSRQRVDDDEQERHHLGW
jgi:hypothetical protein